MKDIMSSKIPKLLSKEASNIVFSFPRLSNVEQLEQLSIRLDSMGDTVFDKDLLVRSLDDARATF